MTAEGGTTNDLITPSGDAVIAGGASIGGAEGRVPLERRPDRRLLVYYVLQSLMTGPVFPVMMVWRLFRFRTLRYTFDEEGVTMRWGVLFRKEVSLTYARIQDLHLVSNIVERWLELGRIQVQTASGSAGAEMTIEGLRDFEELRDRLYWQMRGARTDRAAAEPGAPASTALIEVAATIREAAAELRRVRERLEGTAP
jgi:putative membrane protein